MSKKDYIDAINEIKAEETLKENTLQKIKTTKKKKSNIIYSLALATIAFIIAISIAVPINHNKNTADLIKQVKQDNGLPKIENFENLYNLAKSKNDESRNTQKSEVLFDSTISLTENTDYSKTNTQVEGVDEADIVKTDGEYIYYITNGKLIIVNSADLGIVAEIKYEEEQMRAQEIFINKNKLIIIGQKYGQESEIKSDMLICYENSLDEQTNIKTYNIEDKSQPKLEREIQIEGNYLDSRMIGENVYVLSNKYMYLSLLTKAKEELNENDYKPKYLDTATSNEEKCIEYSDISYFPESEDNTFLNIAGFNINNNEPANIETYLGAGTKIYASQNNLYVAKIKYEYKDEKLYGYYDNYDVNTYIYKFKLKNSKVEYTNTGSVPGEVLNQFSMDEKDGNFRIATTNSTNWKEETRTNNLYILNENLKMIGSLENLAKGEKIYSVRFIENKAYMVTFVQTDPLFVIDLSEPTNPILLGELKIPGYSNYLHPYDENHLIGFGENTETKENGSVVTVGMKMALFDVTNPTSPKEMYSVDIGDKGTYSELLYNHKALLFSKEKNIIAFPISISEGENYHSNTKFQGAIVYGLDLENGFTLKGKIAHMQITDGYKNYDYKKEVERIIYINNNLYTLSKSLIKVTNMENMEEIGNIEIK